MRVTNLIANKQPDYALNNEIHHEILTRLSSNNRKFLMNSMRYLISYFTKNKNSKTKDIMAEIEIFSALADKKGILQEFQIFLWDLIAWGTNYGRTESHIIEVEGE